MADPERRSGQGNESRTGRSGLACLAGRPNAGKSTLLNRLVGERVAVATEHPQTTRRPIRGFVTRHGSQIMIVDTPGFHRPRTTLGEHLNAAARGSWSEADLVCWCVAADQPPGKGDRFTGLALRATSVPILVALTKRDLLSVARLGAALAGVKGLLDGLEIDPVAVVPVSAANGKGIEELLDAMAAAMPQGPQIFADGTVTDEPVADRAAEIIRAAALDGARDELPHSIAVTVDEMGPDEAKPAGRRLVRVHATIHVERESQKGIVIGKGGARLREIGTAARADLEQLLGAPVFLDIHVRVARNWQRDPKQLGRFGL